MEEVLAEKELQAAERAAAKAEAGAEAAPVQRRSTTGLKSFGSSMRSRLNTLGGKAKKRLSRASPVGADAGVVGGVGGGAAAASPEIVEDDLPATTSPASPQQSTAGVSPCTAWTSSR